MDRKRTPLASSLSSDGGSTSGTTFYTGKKVKSEGKKEVKRHSGAKRCMAVSKKDSATGVAEFKESNQDDYAEYEATQLCYFGQSYSLSSYTRKLKEEMKNPTQKRRKNLFAFVMPGGHGKTTLSQTYGFIDVDCAVSKSTSHALYELRKNYVYTNTREWVEHNDLFYKTINDTLDVMTFQRPTVILVHTEECAVRIGAKILGILVLERSAFEDNIKLRSLEGRMFSRLSRAFVIHRSINNYYDCASNYQLENTIVSLCNRAGIPIPMPYVFSRRYRNKWYSDSVPDWILTGRTRMKREETDTVIRLYDQGHIPKECVDQFVRMNCPSGRAFGFGVTMNDWAELMAKVTGSVPSHRHFEMEDDLFKIFPPASKAEEHRVNVTLKRLRDKTDYMDDDEVYTILGRHVGEKHVFVTSLVCHWLGIGRHLPLQEYFFVMYLVPFRNFSAYHQDFHNLIRLSNWYCTTPITEQERQGMMYTYMLVGRKNYEADWKKVVEERKKNPDKDFVSYDPIRGVWSRGQYLRDFDNALLEGYSRMFSNPKPVNVEHFLQFWKRRRSWVAKGSTVLTKLNPKMLKYTTEFLDKMAYTLEMRHNKKSLFENYEVLDLIKETEETWNLTKVVPKLNETGKERELLPGTLMHYLVFSYVLYVAEKQDPVGSTRLNVNDDDAIQYYDRKMEAGLYHMLYDWANFNAQHTTGDMAKVIELLGLLPSAPRDYAPFCRAIAEGFYHMGVIDPDGKVHKLDKGLYSGWRGTTWINTVLNFIYVNIAVRCCERLYPGFDPTYFDHGGDDLDIGFKKPEDCFRIMEVMDAIGYEAKAIKQMVDRKSEFFRNTITGEGVFASSTRALANFVSGNWETAGAKKLSEKTNSVLDQVAKLERRGVDADFCNSIAKVTLEHWLKIKMDDEWFELKPEIIHGDVDYGGLGVPDSDGMVWKIKHDLQDRVAFQREVTLPGSYCSQDYTDIVEAEINKYGIKLVDKARLVNKLAKQSYDIDVFEERDFLQRLNRVPIKVVDKKTVVIPKWNPELFDRFVDWLNSKQPGLQVGKAEMLEEFLGHLEYGGRLLTRRELVNLCVNKQVSDDVLEFKGDVYYRRLVPDFLANHIDKYIKYWGHEMQMSKEEMQEEFKTLCFMCKVIYRHRA